MQQLRSNEMPENLFLVDHNFAEGDIFSTLAECQFDKSKKTLVIAEGLTPYLTDDEVQVLLSSIKDNLNEETQVLISFSKLMSKEETLDKAVRGQAGELYQSELRPDDIIPFINEHGYVVKQKLMHNDFHSKMSFDAEKVNGEFQENYVLITPSENDVSQENDINSVPDMPELDTLGIENVNQAKGWCNIM